MVHTLKYGNGKETLTIKEVITSAYAKEAELKEKGLGKRPKSNAEGMMISRGRTDKRYENQGKYRSKIKGFHSKSRGKSQAKARECWVCGRKVISNVTVLNERNKDLQTPQMWLKKKNFQ